MDFILFYFIFWFFETGFLSVALAVLDLLCRSGWHMDFEGLEFGVTKSGDHSENKML